MSNMPRTTRAALCAATLLCGCASVSSTVIDVQAPVEDGVLYYMPSRPIVVSIQMPSEDEAKKGKQPVPSIDAVASVPDYRRRFFLAYNNNLLGKNHLKIEVSPSGLLTSSNADTTSSIPDIVKSLGTIAGYASAGARGKTPDDTVAPPPPAPKSECLPGRTYTHLFDLRPAADPKSVDDVICGYHVTVMALDGSALSSPPDTTRLNPPGEAQSGLFYRQDRPFQVVVQDPDNGPKSSLIAFSPNLSPIAFLPVSRSFFSDNHTNVVFNNGTLSSVDTQIDGEIAALVKLPADFIEAYMKAVGGLFTSFGNNTKAQSTAIDNQRALTLSSTQRQVCDLAVQANKPTLQVDPNALLSADRITAIASATQAVKAACSP